MYHRGTSTEETFASHRLKSQAISTQVELPPKIANLEQLAITVKEVPSLIFLPAHSYTGI